MENVSKMLVKPYNLNACYIVLQSSRYSNGGKHDLILLHIEWPKLRTVLAVLTAIRLVCSFGILDIFKGY